jgi:two-component system copper resistance phosphate regulon response regulator CusR
MAILVIEDDTKTGNYLQKGLTEAGHHVDLARNGVDGLHLAREQRYELLILDVMLPGKDGWQVMEELRQSSDVPVIFLTARDQVEDRIHGLRLGADDYLVKPFSFTELALRVQTLLRRGVNHESSTLRLANLELDPVRRKVVRGGITIALTNKEFTLLHLLMRRQGEALPRTIIASQVWDMNFDSDTNVVDVAIKRLRAKIDAPFDQKLIQTVRSIGYMLAGHP